MIHKNRGNRRKQDATKAIRKKRLSQEIYDADLYDNLHEYSKGKIHCSCPICRAKTNAGKSSQTTGPSSNNWKPSDKKKIMSMDQQQEEFVEEDL